VTFSEFLVLECSVRKRLGDEEAEGGEREGNGQLPLVEGGILTPSP